MTHSYRLPETFETDHYRLRRIQIEDAPLIFDAYAHDPVVTKYLTWKPVDHVQATADHIRMNADNWDRGSSFATLAFHRDDPERLLGSFDVRVNGARVNFGYALRASAWGQGCASEIMGFLVAHALAHPTIYRAEAFCDTENAASARVMEKAGMTREGTLRRYLIHPNISNEPRDCFVYAKVR